MPKINTLLVFVLLVSAAPSTAIAPTNERPLADAGLDQRVRKGTTVLLDGAGSRDPDGAIESYEWYIRTPGGGSERPADPDDPSTRFRPDELGRYAVTLTVTDDDGATSTDTLYVTVSPGRRPSIDLSGPAARTVGDQGRYTAELTAGDAALHHVVWTVDGDIVANHTLSGDRATDSLSKTFPNTGSRTIRATIHDVDGQHRSTSLAVSVEPRPASTGTPAGTPSIADSASPTIDGPKLVTGIRPLTGGYSLRTGVSSARIESVSWQTISAAKGRGRVATIDWSPGTHRLYAVVDYVDGSRDIAKFADGSMRVAADPKPRIEIGELDGFGSIAGSPRATDGFGNLRSLRVEVDGAIVATWSVDLLEQRRAGDVLERRFDYRNVAFGQEHTVRVIATDMRGQKTAREAVVEPVGRPVIVKSEFVNGPVDSYHQRIDASRYAAHHVLKIDLNGVDPENVVVNYNPRSSDLNRLDTDDYHQTRTLANGKLTVESYWSGNSPATYVLKSTLEVSGMEDSSVVGTSSEFTVSPSDPELRYEVLSDGTIHQKTDWGIIVDASRSFDPDHTNIRYVWQGGAHPISKDNATGKFNSFRLANLKINDGNNGSTINRFKLLNYYNPGFSQVEPTVNRPYKPNETVKLRILTNPYKLTKNRYDISLGVEAKGANHRLTTWTVTKVGEDCELGNCGLPEITDWMRDDDNHRFSFYSGVIEMKASELSDGAVDPRIVLYNEGHPKRTQVIKPLPEVNVLTKGSRIWENVTVTDLEYTVERPIEKQVTTQNRVIRDQYLRDGYSIQETGTGTEFLLEKRVQTQQAKYETRTQSFHRSQIRSVFLEDNPEWSTGDSYSTTEKWTTTETEWRDAKAGRGTFTGQTRRLKTDPAEYRIKKQFEYDYEVERTGTRIVWRTKRVQVRKTQTRTVTRCNRYFGCYQTTETDYYWDTEYYSYQTTETYTYTETETGHYWAYSGQGYDHRFTGQTQRIKVDDADYKTQYEYRYRKEHSETIWHYEVTRRVQTQEAKYEWRVSEITTDESFAKVLASQSSEWRIGDTRPTYEWTLGKYVGTKREVVSSYDNPSHVIKTRATVRGDVKQRYLNTETGSTVTESVGTMETRYHSDIAETKQQIIDHFIQVTTDDSPADRLKDKLVTSQIKTRMESL